MSAREVLEKWLTRRHPVDVQNKLDDYRNEIILEVAEHIRGIYHGREGYDYVDISNTVEGMAS